MLFGILRTCERCKLKLFCLFLQLRWAKQAVRQSVSNGSRNQPGNLFYGLGLKLSHMVDSLEQYVMYVVTGAWQELDKVLVSQYSQICIKDYLQAIVPSEACRLLWESKIPLTWFVLLIAPKPRLGRELG